MNKFLHEINFFATPFKGTVSRDFQHFFLFFLKDSIWATNKQAKTVSQTFSFSRRYSIAKFENHVSTQSTTTPKFFFRYAHFHILTLLLLGWCLRSLVRVRLVIDYAITMSESRWLRWHGVSVVVDPCACVVVEYADTHFSWNRFCLFTWSPGGVFDKKSYENLVTSPFKNAKGDTIPCKISYW